MVWMTLCSGRGTFQTSFTPSAQICGFRPWRPKWSIAAVVRWPCVPSASTVTVATASLVARSHADDAAVLDEEALGARLRQDRRPGAFRLLPEEACELRGGHDPVALVPHRRWRWDAPRPARGEDVHGLAVHLPVV